MDAFENVRLERSGDFATITMNNPAKRNALSLTHMRELITAFREVGDSDALGVVLAANGKVFSAGHDFAEHPPFRRRRADAAARNLRREDDAARGRGLGSAAR